MTRDLWLSRRGGADTIALVSNLRGWWTAPRSTDSPTLARVAVPIVWAMIAVVVIGAYTPLRDAAGVRGAQGTAMLALAVTAAVVVMHLRPARRGPEAVAASLIGLAGAGVAPFAPGAPAFLTVYVALVTLGLRLPALSAGVLGFFVLAGADVLLAVAGDTASQLISTDLGAAFMFAVALLVRSSRTDARLARELLEQTHVAQEERERAAALGERARVAREIHDILAHSMTGLVLALDAAGVLAARTGADAALRAQVDRAQRLARDGLTESRRAVSTLRGDALAGPELLPQLVRDAAASGLQATFSIVGDPVPLSPLHGLAVYRTAQEALTNAAKHAGPRAKVDVRLEWSGDAVALEVLNTGTTASPVATTVGYGLAGMRERAELLDGQLLAGPYADGFRVRLELPAVPR